MNTLIISVFSGVNADGFDINIQDEKGNLIFRQPYEYRYGFNASWKKDFATSEKPFVTDIIDCLIKIFNIKKIITQNGKNIFTEKENTTTDKFFEKYIKQFIE